MNRIDPNGTVSIGTNNYSAANNNYFSSGNGLSSQNLFNTSNDINYGATAGLAGSLGFDANFASLLAQNDSHYGRNTNQSDPWSRVEDVPKEWFENWGETGTHNIGTSGNQDWRGTAPDNCLDSRCRSKEVNPYKGWQLIYDQGGDLVTDPVNEGTFDYGRPGTLEHLNRDVTPWIENGNSPDDPTTREQRIDALPGSIRWIYK